MNDDEISVRRDAPTAINDELKAQQRMTTEPQHRGPRGRWLDDADTILDLLKDQDVDAWFTPSAIRATLGLTIKQWQRAVAALGDQLRRTYRAGGRIGGVHLVWAAEVWCPDCTRRTGEIKPGCRRCKGLGTVTNSP